MLVAYVWHFWIGVLLFFVSVLAVVGLLGGYLKSVTSKQYPGKRNRRDD